MEFLWAALILAIVLIVEHRLLRIQGHLRAIERALTREPDARRNPNLRAA